jgi:hypothetical protein
VVVIVGNTLSEGAVTQIRSLEESNSGGLTRIIAVEDDKFDEVSFRVGYGTAVTQ